MVWEVRIKIFLPTACYYHVAVEMDKAYIQNYGPMDFWIACIRECSCLGGTIESRSDVERFDALGVTRLIVSPWKRSPDAVDALMRFAEAFVSA